jgi:AcrR family transcriptional regulator
MTDPSVTLVDTAGRSDPRARRTAEEREAQIIAAAFTAFAANGFDETRLEDIARLAGVAKGTIYLYFPNKEALFREMIRRMVVVQLDALETAPREHEPLADFNRVVRTYWGYVTAPEFPVLYRLVSSVLPRIPELQQFFSERVSLRWQRLLQGCIDACVGAGVFGATQAPQAARMLHALLIQHALMRANPTICNAIRLQDADDVLDRVLSFFHAAMRPTVNTSAPHNAQPN